MSSSHDVLEALRRLEGSLYERLSADFKSEIGQFRLEVNGRFDAIEARLDRLEQEYQMLADEWQALGLSDEMVVAYLTRPRFSPASLLCPPTGHRLLQNRRPANKGCT